MRILALFLACFYHLSSLLASPSLTLEEFGLNPAILEILCHESADSCFKDDGENLRDQKTGAVFAGEERTAQLLKLQQKWQEIAGKPKSSPAPPSSQKATIPQNDPTELSHAVHETLADSPEQNINKFYDGSSYKNGSIADGGHAVSANIPNGHNSINSAPPIHPPPHASNLPRPGNSIGDISELKTKTLGRTPPPPTTVIPVGIQARGSVSRLVYVASKALQNLRDSPGPSDLAESLTLKLLGKEQPLKQKPAAAPLACQTATLACLNKLLENYMEAKEKNPKGWDWIKKDVEEGFNAGMGGEASAKILIYSDSRLFKNRGLWISNPILSNPDGSITLALNAQWLAYLSESEKEYNLLKSMQNLNPVEKQDLIANALGGRNPETLSGHLPFLLTGWMEADILKRFRREIAAGASAESAQKKIIESIARNPIEHELYGFALKFASDEYYQWNQDRYLEEPANSQDREDPSWNLAKAANAGDSAALNKLIGMATAKRDASLISDRETQTFPSTEKSEHAPPKPKVIHNAWAGMIVYLPSSFKKTPLKKKQETANLAEIDAIEKNFKIEEESSKDIPKIDTAHETLAEAHKAALKILQLQQEELTRKRPYLIQSSLEYLDLGRPEIREAVEKALPELDPSLQDKTLLINLALNGSGAAIEKLLAYDIGIEKHSNAETIFLGKFLIQAAKDDRYRAELKDILQKSRAATAYGNHGSLSLQDAILSHPRLWQAIAASDLNRWIPLLEQAPPAFKRKAVLTLAADPGSRKKLEDLARSKPWVKTALQTLTPKGIWEERVIQRASRADANGETELLGREIEARYKIYPQMFLGYLANEPVVSPIIETAGRTGIDPYFLAAAAFQEGYIEYARDVERGSVEGNGVGYFFSASPMGLDSFADYVGLMKRKGYLRKDYHEYKLLGHKFTNEANDSVQSAEFKDAPATLEAFVGLLRLKQAQFLRDAESLEIPTAGLSRPELDMWNYLYYNFRNPKNVLKNCKDALKTRGSCLMQRETDAYLHTRSAFNAKRVGATAEFLRKLKIFETPASAEKRNP